MTLEPPLIRVGLLGHGQAGAILHAPLIEAAGAFRICAVATSHTASLAERRDAPRQEAVAHAVIEADDVDLVVIATPNASHFQLAQAALEAGKHVVVDKPFTLAAAEADRLIELAETRGCVLTVFHNRRLDGDFLGVRRAIGSGELGELRLFEARWDRFRPRQTWKRPLRRLRRRRRATAVRRPRNQGQPSHLRRRSDRGGAPRPAPPAGSRLRRPAPADPGRARAA